MSIAGKNSQVRREQEQYQKLIWHQSPLSNMAFLGALLAPAQSSNTTLGEQKILQITAYNLYTLIKVTLGTPSIAKKCHETWCTACLCSSISCSAVAKMWCALTAGGGITTSKLWIFLPSCHFTCKVQISFNSTKLRRDDHKVTTWTTASGAHCSRTTLALTWSWT